MIVLILCLLELPSTDVFFPQMHLFRVHLAQACIHKCITKILNVYSQMCIHSKSVWLTVNECTLEYAFVNTQKSSIVECEPFTHNLQP